MPALSPTMEQGNLAKWHVKEGDAIQPGSLLADVETDKASMPFENQEPGFVAKLLVAEGARDLPLGTPLLVVVEEAADVAAFANYAGGSNKGAAAAPSKGPAKAAPQPAAAPSTSAQAAPAASAAPAPANLPPHQVSFACFFTHCLPKTCQTKCMAC